MTSRLATLCLVVLIGWPASVLAQGAVLTTGSNAPGSYPTLQAAINAASDGDVILVQGPTSAFAINGKSLVIQADAPTMPTVGAGVAHGQNQMGSPSPHNRVLFLTEGQTVVLRGLSLEGLELKDVAGQVWIEDCEIHTFSPALRAQRVDALVIERTLVSGANEFLMNGFPNYGGHGLEFIGVDAVLHEVTVRGGDGQDFGCIAGVFCTNVDGFDAAALTGGSFEASNSVFHGGAGGTGGVNNGFCISGSDGGFGVALLAQAPVVSLRDVTATGGVGGVGPTSSCPIGGSNADGADGWPYFTGSGAINTHAPAGGRLSASTPAREGETLSITLDADPGAQLVLLLDTAPGVFPVFQVQGPLLVTPAFDLLLLGNMPGSGQLVLSAPVPELGPGVDVLPLTAQIVHKPVGGGWIAGSGSAIVLLDGGL